MSAPLVIARAEGKDVVLLPRLANRHGLITGATGTGKTVTLQKMVETFASIGVPSFVADVKGDLAGAAAPGVLTDRLHERLAMMGISDFTPRANTVIFWDVFGEFGHPLRATISDLGPLLLARLLNLNDTQSGVLQIAFKVADDNGLLLLDLKDLRAMLQFVGENARQFTTEYGNISAASIGAIQRGLLTLEEQGGDVFFGEPMLDLEDLLQTDASGRGVINILAANRLYNSPRLYSTFLLWLLADLFDRLPEVGDLDQPRLVFFFDETHLLFNDIPDALLEKIEQVVRLVRSKGVGVYFVTQNPLDIPDSVLGQLGNRVQHALRAFTPRDQRAVKAAADTMRPNPRLDTAKAITELAVGEALVSFLDEKGRPEVVERAFILPPASRLGPLTDEERRTIIRTSVLYGHYEQVMDRESAYERLIVSAEASAGRRARTSRPSPSERGGSGLERESSREEAGMLGGLGEVLEGLLGGGKKRRSDSILEAAAKSAVRSIGSQVGRAIVRGVLGTMLGDRRR